MIQLKFILLIYCYFHKKLYRRKDLNFKKNGLLIILQDLNLIKKKIFQLEKAIIMYGTRILIIVQKDNIMK